MEKDSVAQRIAQKARSSIGKYCFEECSAYCCRKGYLYINKKQVKLVLDGKEQIFIKEHILSQSSEDKFTLFLGDPDFPCPALKEFKCTIHKNSNRPKACKEFPLFLEENRIRLSERCPAVRVNLLYPYIKKLISLGYVLEKRVIN